MVPIHLDAMKKTSSETLEMQEGVPELILKLQEVTVGLAQDFANLKDTLTSRHDNIDLEDQRLLSCTGHMTPCDGHDLVCYQTVPSMDGVCLTTGDATR